MYKFNFGRMLFINQSAECDQTMPTANIGSIPANYMQITRMNTAHCQYGPPPANYPGKVP